MAGNDNNPQFVQRTQPGSTNQQNMQQRRSAFNRGTDDVLIKQLYGLDLSSRRGMEQVSGFISSGGNCREISHRLRLASDILGFAMVYTAIKEDLRGNSDLQHAFAWRGRDYVTQMDAGQRMAYEQIATSQLANFLEHGQDERANNFIEHVQSVLPDFSAGFGVYARSDQSATSYVMPVINPLPSAPIFNPSGVNTGISETPASISVLSVSSANLPSAGPDTNRPPAGSTFLYFLGLQQTGNLAETNFYMRQRSLLSRQYAKTLGNAESEGGSRDIKPADAIAKGICNSVEQHVPRAMQMLQITQESRSDYSLPAHDNSFFKDCTVYEIDLSFYSGSNNTLKSASGFRRSSPRSKGILVPGSHYSEKGFFSLKQHKFRKSKSAKINWQALWRAARLKDKVKYLLKLARAKHLTRETRGGFVVNPVPRISKSFLPLLKQLKTSLLANMQKGMKKSSYNLILCQAVTGLQKRISQKIKQLKHELRKIMCGHVKKEAAPVKKELRDETYKKLFNAIAEIEDMLRTNRASKNIQKTSVQKFLSSMDKLFSLFNRTKHSDCRMPVKFSTGLEKLKKLLYLFFLIRLLLLFERKNKRKKKL